MGSVGSAKKEKMREVQIKLDDFEKFERYFGVRNKSIWQHMVTEKLIRDFWES